MSKTLDIRKFYREVEIFRLAKKKMPTGKKGWISKFREELNMPLSFIARQMKVTPQAVYELEKNENLYYSRSKEEKKTGGVSIDAMNKLAEALDMTFVYGFVPNGYTPFEGLKGRLKKQIKSEIHQSKRKYYSELDIEKLVEDRVRKMSKSEWAKIFDPPV